MERPGTIDTGQWSTLSRFMSVADATIYLSKTSAQNDNYLLRNEYLLAKILAKMDDLLKGVRHELPKPVFLNFARGVCFRFPSGALRYISVPTSKSWICPWRV